MPDSRPTSVVQDVPSPLLATTPADAAPSEAAPALSALVPRTRSLPLQEAAWHEGALTSASRVMTGNSVMIGLALSLGAGHLAIGAYGSIPMLARTVQTVVPGWISRFGTRRVAYGSWSMETGSYLVIGCLGVQRPAHAVLWLLVALATGSLGATTYDVCLTAIYANGVPRATQGRFYATRQRWFSGAGVFAGILGGIGIDITEHRLHVAPHLARSAAVLGGVLTSIIVLVALRRVLNLRSALKRDRAADPRGIPTTPVTRRRAREEAEQPRGGFMSRFLSPRSGVTLSAREWKFLEFAGLWGLAFGLTARHSDEAALTLLHYSLGGLAIMAGITAGAGALGAGFWGRVSDRFGVSAVLGFAVAAIAVMPLWYVVSMYTHPGVLLGGQVWYGMASAGWAILLPVWLTGQGDGESEGGVRLYALFQAVYGIAAGIGPLLGGLLLSACGRWGDATAFAILFLASTVLRLLALDRYRRLPTESVHRSRDLMVLYWSRHRRRWATRAADWWQTITFTQDGA